MLTSQDLNLLAEVILERKGTQRGQEILFQCPSHEDTNPSASYNTSLQVWKCFSCSEKGTANKLREQLEINFRHPCF